MEFTFAPIGIAHTCFTEKFGTPRQPGLIPDATGYIEFLPPYDTQEAFRELEQFSHVWLVFVFHQHVGKWQPTVRPPRLGGNVRVGVFASRSSFRPNPIGLSVVRNNGLERSANRLRLHIGGVDLINGTPILDIKPYIPYTDALPAAQAGYANHAPAPTLAVEFSAEALRAVEESREIHPHLEALIREVIGLDPRPAFHAESAPGSDYGITLYNLNIRWQVDDNTAMVTSIRPV